MWSFFFLKCVIFLSFWISNKIVLSVDQVTGISKLEHFIAGLRVFRALPSLAGGLATSEMVAALSVRF
jgi:hypothetical protein